MDNIIGKIGARIRSRRISLNMTQDELAKLVGYTSRSSINKIELGLTDIPQKKLALIADALCVSPSHLLGLETAPPPKENPPTLELSEDERMFVEILRQIPEEERELYYALLKKRVATP